MAKCIGGGAQGELALKRVPSLLAVPATPVLRHFREQRLGSLDKPGVLNLGRGAQAGLLDAHYKALQPAVTVTQWLAKGYAKFPA